MSPAERGAPGFPFGLTIAALLGIAVLIGLGAWQVARLHWKEGVIAHVAALAHAPARPLAQALQSADPAFTRVEAECASSAPAPRALFRYGVQDGRIGWRLLGACRTPAGPYDGIVLDRGYVRALDGLTSPRPLAVAPPARVVGVLRSAGPPPWLGQALMAAGAGFSAWRVMDHASLRAIAAEGGLRRPAPLFLAVERETPPAPGLDPSALPPDIPNNHLAYALTWFALAAVLAWFYGAMLVARRRR